MTGISGLALVTGASCGVGFALAEQFARRGYDLIVADSYGEIDIAAAALTVLGTDVQAMQADVHSVDEAYLLHRRAMARKRPVVAAALSAPVPDGLCLDDSLDSALEEVDASVRGTMLLARLLADEMVRHGSGDIILAASPVDSVAGLDAAVYLASSAFLRAFAETLQDELSESRVKVTVLMPEPVEAGGGGFGHFLGALVKRTPASAPADIARQAFAALRCNDKQGIAAWATDAVSSLASLLPDSVRGPVRQLISPTGEAV
jgi:short-subunit dehydrogenase